MLPCTVEDVLAGWPCLFERGGAPLVEAALRELDAGCDHEGVWWPPR